jgi:UDP-N-acetylmuramate dehydrogenase
MADQPARLGLLKHVARIEEQYSLASFNPLGAGGVADFFAVANDTVELASAIKAAIDMQMPYQVIGGGNGVLFADGGYPGLVIHNKAASFAFARDKSQVVVDSGLSLSRFITLAASHGLGGMTEFYGDTGTVGGALYSGSTANGQSLASSVRYLTMIMPPTRLDKEATINRYKREWLERPSGETRLQHLRETRPFGEPTPVILTALFQLTSLRQDEVRTRLQNRSQEPERHLPEGVVMGPIFSEDAGLTVDEILRMAGVAKLKIGGVYPDRYSPNFFRCELSRARSQDIRTLIEEIQAIVQSRYSVTLSSRYEYGGVW